MHKKAFSPVWIFQWSSNSFQKHCMNLVSLSKKIIIYIQASDSHLFPWSELGLWLIRFELLSKSPFTMAAWIWSLFCVINCGTFTGTHVNENCMALILSVAFCVLY